MMKMQIFFSTRINYKTAGICFETQEGIDETLLLIIANINKIYNKTTFRPLSGIIIWRYE